MGYSPRGRKKSDTTEQLHFTSLQGHTLENLFPFRLIASHLAWFESRGCNTSKCLLNNT